MIDTLSIPRLAAGCRLHPTEPLLLIPEGTLALTGPAVDILSQLDGRRSVAEVIDLLLAQFAGADRAMIQEDVLNLLERLQQRGVIRT